MSWEPEQVWELVDFAGRSHPIVAGAYHAVDYSSGEVFWQHVPHDVEPRTIALTRVDGTGMGFTAINMRALKAITDRWHDPYGELDTDVYGRVDQDVGFCIRAAELGFNTFVANIPIGHIKERVI